MFAFFAAVDAADDPLLVVVLWVFAIVLTLWTVGAALCCLIGASSTYFQVLANADALWAGQPTSSFAGLEAEVSALGFRPLGKIRVGAVCWGNDWWSSFTQNIYTDGVHMAALYRLRWGEAPRIGMMSRCSDGLAFASSTMPDANVTDPQYIVRGRACQSAAELLTAHRALAAECVAAGRTLLPTTSPEDYGKYFECEVGSPSTQRAFREIAQHALMSFATWLAIFGLGAYFSPQQPWPVALPATIVTTAIVNLTFQYFGAFVTLCECWMRRPVA